MIGRTVTHYRILEKLGGGGMGVVYKAEDLKLGRTVALKFLPPEATRDEEAKRRFFHEARAAAALDHPNICTLYEVDETAEGEVFLSMACYEGETLKRRLDRGPVPWPEALRIAVQVCDGLSKAHQRGIIHRDIKPANLMITPEGIVKILDFGLAKLAGQTTLTQDGATLGTVAYMSPEQARGVAVDSRTDLWALGAVLYEMLTGRPPFAGEYAQAVIYSILNESPEPPSAICPGLPPDMERVVGRALAKDPAQRFAGVAEMAAALRALTGESAPARAMPEPAPELPPAGSTDRLPSGLEEQPVSIGPAQKVRPPWWLYAAALPFFCYFLAAYYQNIFGPEALGLKWVSEQDGSLIQEVWENSAAASSGLQPGDKIVSVDGQPATLAVMRHLYWYAEAGRAYRLEFLRQGERRTVNLLYRRVTLRYWGSQAGLFDLINIITSMFFLVLALFIAFSKPDDPLARMGSLWMVFWGIALSWNLVGAGSGFDRFLGQLPLPLAVLILLAPILAIGLSAEYNLIFMASFPVKFFRARWVYILLWLSTLPRLSIMGFQILRNHLTSSQFVLWPWLLPLFASIRLVYWIGAISVLIWNYRNLGDLNLRRRMRLFVTGVCLCLLSTLIQSLGSIRIWDFQKPMIALYWSTPLPLVISMAMAAAGIMMAVAIVKHRLFGFRMMIRRSLQYAAARGLLLSLAPFCLAVFVGDLLLHADQPLGAILASRGWFYAVLGIGGALAHFNRKHWQDVLDRRFFRERYDVQQILVGVVQEISRATTLEDVAPRVVAQVEAALHPLFAALLRRGAGAAAFHVLAADGQGFQSGGSQPAEPVRLELQQSPLPSGGKLTSLIRVLGKPVEISESGSNWLWRQLPPQETEWLRRVRVEWLFPVSLSASGPEVLLVLGPKRSEEPYSQEDQDLLSAVTSALALRMGSSPALVLQPSPWAPDRL